jgi:hypothetical protein
MSALAVGMRLSSYELLDQIGATRMSEVWRARDGMGRIVALKTISSKAGDDAQLRARFLREGGEHKQLKHANIVPIFDFFEQDNGFYLVMQYIPGGSLEDRMYEYQWGPLPVRDALRISRQILPALDYAHQHGIIHRDVKPSNILLDGPLDGDRAYLSDFGIALAVGQPRLTSITQMVGTFPYMSPEQLRSPRGITHLTDVYSYGCVLYQMLTGHRPHDWNDAEDEHVVLARRVREAPVPPRQFNPEVPSRLERIVMTALATNPQDRFSGCGTFAKAIEISETDSGFIASLPNAGNIPGKGAVAGFVPAQGIPAVGGFQPTAKSAAVTVSGNVMASLFAGWFWLTFLGQNVETVRTILVLCIIVTNILFLRLLYKAWSILPASFARTTPGKAVGYLLIPLYNLYWAWNAIPGFAHDYNKYVAQSQSFVKPQPVKFYNLFCALYLYVTWALGIATGFRSNEVVAAAFLFNLMIMIPIMTGVLATAINRLAGAAKKSAGARAAEPMQR